MTPWSVHRRAHARWLAVVPFVLAGCLAELDPDDDRKPPERPPFGPRSTVPCCGAESATGQHIPEGGSLPAGCAPPDRRLELPIWDLTISEQAWDDLHEDVFADAEIDASLCVDGERYPIELELQGSSTRDLPKKSFKLKWNRGKTFHGDPFDDGGEPGGMRKLILKAMFQDPSLIREALAFDLLRDMGVHAPRTGFANLRINGAHFGLYAVVEPVDEDYLERRGYPPGGRLYKAVRKHGERADFAPGRDLTRAFENETGEHPPSWHDLEELVRRLQHTELTEEAFEREIDPIFPLDAYFDRMIWVSFTQNGDATAQNFYLYNTGDDEHPFWHILPWDSNLCFGALWSDFDGVLPPHRSLLLDGRNHFGRRLTRIDGLRARYVERFRRVMDEVLTPQRVHERYHARASAVAADLEHDRERWNRNVGPEDAFDVLLDFFAERPTILRDALDEFEESGRAPSSMDPTETD